MIARQKLSSSSKANKRKNPKAMMLRAPGSSVLQPDVMPKKLLAHDFVDEMSLLTNYGLTKNEHGHFNKVYWSIDRSERPTLSVFFDPKWYLSQYQDVAENSIDPFVHFCLFGLSEGRSPHPLIQLGYIETVFGIKVASLRQLLDMIRGGVSATSPYFDLAAYKERFPSLEPFDSPLRHFLSAPPNHLFIPCKFFDPDFYMERYIDIPRMPREAFYHFVQTGDAEARVPSVHFDPEWYLRTYRDVAEVGMPPLQHFLTRGILEGRSAVGRRTYSGGNGSGSLRSATIGLSFEVNSVQARDRYEALAHELEDRRLSKTRSIHEYDVLPENCDDISAALSSLSFKASRKPQISILIPLYDELKVTIECLLSIMHSKTRISFEVVVADDCSPDERVQLLSSVPGLRYLRNTKNLNFLRNCNLAYGKLRGEYVLLLNNDAQICGDAIDRLAEALDDPAVGAVGPKLLFPNGRLQEAGCSVNLDASTNMIGVFSHSREPCFSYSRDVDYVSGASMMFKRSVVGDVLFDEMLAPAYCEDLDLCLRIKHSGFKIRYVADAEVVHHLSVSMFDHTKKMANIVRNQHKVLLKWSSEIASSNRVRMIAFYLPQYHPIKENDHWWGTGFTEWTNVSKAEASYAGHYQPHLPADLGFYDLRVREVFVKQAELIQRYGLGGVCLYYYNFGGTRFLGKPLDVIRDNKDIDLPFCLCWANENWSKRWDGGTKDLLLGQSYDDRTLAALAKDVTEAAADPRYIRVDGRPIFLIYRPLLMPDPSAVVRLVRDVGLKEGGLEFHMVFVESLESLEAGVSPLSFGFDASVEFPPHGIAVPSTDDREIIKPGWRGNRFDYAKSVVSAVHRKSVPWPRYPGTFPSWDNTARQPLGGTSFDNCSPEAFQCYIEEQIRKSRDLFCGDSRLVFINAWNEWAEGAHLEPDRAYGHRWLEAVRNALEKEGSI